MTDLEIIRDNHLVGGLNISHYHDVDLDGSDYNDHCYLKVDLNSALDNSTDYIYSSALTVFAGVGCFLESLVGQVLNLIVLLALCKDAKLRKEYLFIPVVSLILTDYLFSITTLPMLSVRFFVR